MNTEKAMDITIMGCEFRLHCPDEESEELLLAAEYVNKKMRKIKLEKKVVGSERIAIITALSIAHELLLMQTGSGFDTSQFRRRIELIEE